MNGKIIGSLTLCAAMLALPGTGSAHVVITPAAGVCKGALPAFDTNLRTRPVAIQNEGSASAYVTCGLPNVEDRVRVTLTRSATLRLLKNGSGAATVTCTAVNWEEGDATSTALYASKSVSVPANGEATLTFVPSDFPGSPVLFVGDLLSFSCNLPVGTGISSTVLENNRD